MCVKDLHNFVITLNTVLTWVKFDHFQVEIFALVKDLLEQLWLTILL